MELMAAVALIALICAWWIVQAQGQQQAKNTTTQQPAADSPSIPAAPRTDLPPENASHSKPGGTLELKPIRPYAEIVDPNGGVREISAEEVSALFRPLERMFASLRKTAVNSTRVAQNFARSGGPTPDVESYRSAHRGAVTLTRETERLLDIILFGEEADQQKYQELLDRIVDVEMEIEDNFALIRDIENEIASGDFLPIKKPGVR